MKKLFYIVFYGGFALALVYAAIAFKLESYYNPMFRKGIGEVGGFPLFMILFMLAMTNMLILERDMGHMPADGEPCLSYGWDDHWGRRMTLFILKRKVLLYATLLIPMLYFFIHLIVEGLYWIKELVIVPICDWFRNAWDWIDDKFFDLRMWLNWP